MKILKTIFLLFIILIVAALIGKNLIARVAIEKGVQQVTGLNLKLDNIDVGLTKTYIDVDNLRLDNPKAFEDRVMFSMPDLFVDYELQDILKGNMHLKEVRLELSEFYIIRDKEGKLNLDYLKEIGGKDPAKADEPKSEQKPAEPAKEVKIQLDLFALKIGKVVYKDYSKGISPEVKEFNINLQEEFRDIDNVNSIVKIIVLKALSRANLANLLNFDLGTLETGLGTVLSSSTKIAGDFANKGVDEVTGQAKEILKKTGLEDTKLGGAVEGVTGELKDVAGSLTKSLKSPFSKKEE
jgi:hypothetical protein